jgi:hypothetical protein
MSDCPDFYRPGLGQLTGRRRPPMTLEEQRRIFELQVELRAVKRCDRCGELRQMDLFEPHVRRVVASESTCEPCRRARWTERGHGLGLRHAAQRRDVAVTIRNGTRAGARRQ